MDGWQTMHVWGSGLCACLWVAALGCGAGGSAGSIGSGDPARGAGAATTQRPSPASHMNTSFELINAARAAVADGDLARARAQGKALRDASEYDGLPRDWRPWIARVRRRAATLSVAPDLPAAGDAVAAVGLVCGNCHWLSGRGPSGWGGPENVEALPSDADLDARMARHRLASDAMWWGLLQPSDKLWRLGTETFAVPALAAPLEGPGRDAEDVRALGTLAREASAAVTHPERAARYGQILARCGDCHRAR